MNKAEYILLSVPVRDPDRAFSDPIQVMVTKENFNEKKILNEGDVNQGPHVLQFLYKLSPPVPTVNSYT